MSVLDLVMEQLDPNTIQRMAGQLGATPQQTQSAIAAALPVLLGAMQRNAAQPEGAAALHRAVTRDHLNVDLGGLLGGILGGGSSGGGGDLMGVLGSVLGGGAPAPAPAPARRNDGDMLGILGSVFGGSQAPAPAPAPQPRGDGGLMGVLGSVLGGGSSGTSAGGGMGEAILRHVLGGNTQRAANGVSQASGLDLGAVLKLLPMLAPLIMAALGRMTQSRQLDAGGLGGLLGQDVQRFGGAAPSQRGFLSSVLDADGDGDVDASDLMARASQVFGAFNRQ